MRLRTLPVPLPLALAGVVLSLFAAPRLAEAAWPASGRAIVTAPRDQVVTTIASDGADGAIVTWVDLRDSTVNIFSRRVLASGELDASWPVDGRALRANPLALAGEPEDPAFPVSVPDGAGGAIVAWQDGRSNVTLTDIFAQHVLASGALDSRWPANGTPLSRIEGLQDIPTIASDGAGGAIVTWMDGRPGASIVDVYAQHVLATGAVDPRWPVNGLAVSTAEGPQEFPAIVGDGAGGAFITWYDLRGTGTGFDIYAQHVLNSGVADPAWPVNGLVVCGDRSDQFGPTITSDGSGGAIIAWDDNRNASFHPFVHHVLASGQVDPGWPLDGLAIPNNGITDEFPKLVPDGGGGAIVTWQSRNLHINMMAHHVKSKGDLDEAWPANGRALSITDTNQLSGAIVPDGAGGAIVAWQDNLHIVAQHVLASGALDPLYPSTGRAMSSLPTQEGPPFLAATGGGGAIVAWTDIRSENNADVYAIQVLEAVTTGVPDSTPPGTIAARPSPNPARGPLTLRFALSRQTQVRLEIYDAAGRRVRGLASGALPAGAHALAWDLHDERGTAVGTGLYFARLEADGRVFTTKIVTVR